MGNLLRKDLRDIGLKSSTLEYRLLSVPHYISDAGIMETYGIECTMYHNGKTVTKRFENISTDFEFVDALLHLMFEHSVLPNHLSIVVHEYMNNPQAIKTSKYYRADAKASMKS